jgi:hypothetical protein
MKLFAAFVLVAGSFCVSAAAQAQSARSEFEKRGLLGTHTIDCSKPLSENNSYIIYRAFNERYVQRDTMVGPTTRTFASIAQAVSAQSPNELTVTGTVDGKKLVYTIRIDKTKHRIWAWTEDGVKSVENGIWTEHKFEMPWLDKCG